MGSCSSSFRRKKKKTYARRDSSDHPTKKKRDFSTNLVGNSGGECDVVIVAKDIHAGAFSTHIYDRDFDSKGERDISLKTSVETKPTVGTEKGTSLPNDVRVAVQKDRNISSQRHLFPQDVDLYLEPSISSRVKHLATNPGTVVYVKSPMMTILSAEDDIPVPQSVICDVYVITHESFVMVLTFVLDDNDKSHVNYNSHLVTSLKSIFHRQNQTDVCGFRTVMDVSDVCVVGTVMGETEWKDEYKFKKKQKGLKQQATRDHTRQITDFDITAKFQEFVSKERMTSTFRVTQSEENRLGLKRSHKQ